MIIDKKEKKVLLSRRTLLQGAGLTGAALATGGALGTLTDLAAPTEAKAATTFYKGCDVSWLAQMEATGYKFYNASGTEQDCLAILKSYNCNAIRLRTWVNPSSDPVNGHCSDVETAQMAKRAQNLGMAVLIDIHYGDSWNSVGVQNCPAAWANDNYSQMLNAVNTYTYHLMNVQKYYGVTPTWVQIGNEINSGLLHPVGAVGNGSQMTGLLNAGHDRVKQVFPSAATIIHLAQPQNGSSITNMLNTFFANNGQCDMLGFSSYGASSYADSLTTAMAGFGSQYGKPFMQVENGGPSNNTNEAVNRITGYCQGVRNKGGKGYFYWEPEVYAPFDTWGDGAWQTNGRPISAMMDAFKNA